MKHLLLRNGVGDDATATRVGAELMTLDAEGDSALSLRIDSAEGSLALALTLMDVIELPGVPVRALCMGQVGDPAVGVLAVCGHRAAMPSTRFLLREPTTQMESRAREVEQWAQLRSDERERFKGRVAAAVGRPAATVAASFANGVFMGAQEAMEYG
jgi:ATP-dependent Clp protease, protease subunit